MAMTVQQRLAERELEALRERVLARAWLVDDARSFVAGVDDTLNELRRVGRAEESDASRCETESRRML